MSDHNDAPETTDGWQTPLRYNVSPIPQPGWCVLRVERKPLPPDPETGEEGRGEMRFWMKRSSGKCLMGNVLIDVTIPEGAEVHLHPQAAPPVPFQSMPADEVICQLLGIACWDPLTPDEMH